MKRFLTCLFLVFLSTAVFAGTETQNTVPQSNSSFLSDLQNFLEEEDVDRAADWYDDFVVSGGTGPTSGTLAHTIAAVTGYVSGYYVNVGATAHTYTASRRTYVYLHQDASTPATFSITGGSGCTFDSRSENFVFVECNAGSAAPDVPADSARLMLVDTGGASITNVGDLRKRRPQFPFSGNPYVDVVHDHGVTCDGSTDDRDALAAADSAATSSGTIFFPPNLGTCVIGSNITVSAALQIGNGTQLQPASGVTTTVNKLIEPGLWQVFDETAGGTVTFTEGAVGSVRPEWWGAVRDGTTDDTAAIQGAIDAAANDMPVIFTGGVYEFSSLTVEENTPLVGSGGKTIVNANFGDASWNTLSNHNGSVLKSTATSGVAILFVHPSETRSYRTEGLMVLGPGSGTSVGIRVGTSSQAVVQNRFSDVLVSNFSIGWQVFNSFESTFQSVRSRGNATGLELDNATNNNVFSDLEIQTATVDGLVIKNAAQNVFIGSLFQNISGTAALRIPGTGGNTADATQFVGAWFENVTATNAIDIGASGSVEETLFQGIRVSGPSAPNIVIDNAAGVSFQNSRLFLDTMTITANATGTSLMNSTVDTGTISDSGTRSLHILKNGVVKFGSIGGASPDIAVGDFGAGLQTFTEVGATAAPGADRAMIFAQDNGAGKTQMCARFNTGSIQCFATEP